MCSATVTGEQGRTKGAERIGKKPNALKRVATLDGHPHGVQAEVSAL